MTAADLNLAALDATTFHATKETVILDRGAQFLHMLGVDRMQVFITPVIPNNLIERDVLELHLLVSLSICLRRAMPVRAAASSVNMSASRTCLAPLRSPCNRSNRAS